MSLRAFHIVFVGTCVLLALFLAVWALISVSGVMRYVWAALSVAGAGVLIVYGRAFLTKILPQSNNQP